MAYTKRESDFFIEEGDYNYSGIKFSRIERTSERTRVNYLSANSKSAYLHTCYSANQALSKADILDSGGQKIPSCKQCDDFANDCNLRKALKEKTQFSD